MKEKLQMITWSSDVADVEKTDEDGEDGISALKNHQENHVSLNVYPHLSLSVSTFVLRIVKNTQDKLKT